MAASNRLDWRKNLSPLGIPPFIKQDLSIFSWKGSIALKTRLPKYRLSLPLSLLAAVGLAGCITLLALWCQPNAFRGVISNFLHKPVLILLNALPVGLLLLGLAFLFRSVFFGAALTNLIVCGLSIANRVKIEVRDEPVFPRDLTLLKEVSSAVESYDIRYPAAAIAIVVLATAALAALLEEQHRRFPAGAEKSFTL